MAQGDTRVAIRYAKALFNVAASRGEIDKIAGDLTALRDLMARVPQLDQILRHPRITNERKKQLLHDTLQNQVNADIERFLSLLIDKDRTAVLKRAITEFARLVDEHRREADAEAVTAIPLSEAQTNALKQQLQAVSGYNIRLKTRVDESILGGMIVRVGDKLVDGSVASQLRSLQEQLRRAKVA